jgi:anti-sigma regulatory factor (Ser/Thr protein kinase)
MTLASSLSSFRTVENVLPTETGIAGALSRAVDIFRRAGVRGAHLFSLELSIHEALVNALVHGVHERGASMIRLAYEIDRGCVRVVVEDDGVEGFTQNLGVSPHEGSGRGLFLIQALTSRVSAQGRVISIELDLDAASVSSSDHIPTMFHPGNGLLC